MYCTIPRNHPHPVYPLLSFDLPGDYLLPEVSKYPGQLAILPLQRWHPGGSVRFLLIVLCCGRMPDGWAPGAGVGWFGEE